MNWTNEDITLVEKLVDIKNRGYFADGKQVTELYNKVLGKNLPTTNCGSCIRARITELETALKRYRSLSESVTEEAQTITKEDENKADMKARMAKVRSHRKAKK